MISSALFAITSFAFFLDTAANIGKILHYTDNGSWNKKKSPYFSKMWANNCPAGLLKNKKLYTFVPGLARHFLFRAGKQCELTINFDGEGYRTYAV